jgi:hypothetical protein
MSTELESLLTPVYKLNRDMMKGLRQSGGGVTDTEARFLVDLFYSMQKQRIRTNNQSKGLDRDAKKAANEPEPHDAINWTLTQFDTLEGQIERILKVYVEQHPMAWFFAATVGIGTGILAAGLLAHIDINQAPTAGHIWRFAGLDPTLTWEKKTKRPWNATLKTLCWKIGDSFCKVSGRPDAYYGRIYRERKAYEWERNVSGGNAETAARELGKKAFGDATDARAWLTGQCDAWKVKMALQSGDAPTPKTCAAVNGNGTAMLPPAQIDARARRYAVKLFLSHLQESWWRQETGTEPPAPWIISHGGHAHKLHPPQQRPVKEAA